MAGLRCYHHNNCEDHPAVATCTKCGKGLCRECADNLRSEDTGKILCVDCLNAELQEDVRWAAGYKNALKKEAITMVVGFIIGVIIQIILAIVAAKQGGDAQVLLGLSLILFFPTLLASFGTIIKTTWNVGFWLFRIPVFIILCLVSPIMFIVRIVKRVKKMKIAKRFAQLQIRKQRAYANYAECASQMKTVLTTEEFERELIAKYAKTTVSKEEVERLMAEERAEREQIKQDNARLAKQLDEQGAEIKLLGKERDELKARAEEAEKSSRISKAKNKAHGRSDDEVGSGKKAA